MGVKIILHLFKNHKPLFWVFSKVGHASFHDHVEAWVICMQASWMVTNLLDRVGPANKEASTEED